MPRTKKVLSVEEFEALPIETQRVMIAKDVLAQMKADKIVARRGSYVNYISMHRNIPFSSSVRDNYDQISFCSVCALGACLMSATKYKNRLSFNDVDVPALIKDDKKSYKRTFDVIAEIFTPEQLLLIEIAFEGGGNGDRVGRDVYDAEIGNDQCEKAIRFHERYWGRFQDKSVAADKLLKAIMRNIIRNNGTFVL